MAAQSRAGYSSSRALGLIQFVMFAVILTVLLTPTHADAAAGYRWKVDKDGEWTNAANWQLVAGDANGFGYPNGVGDSALFNGNYTADRAIVFGNQTLTVGQIFISTAVHITIVAGAGGKFVFSTGGAGPASIIDISTPFYGNKIDAPIVLHSDMVVGNAPGGRLRLSNITEDGGPRSFTMNGNGFLHLTRANGFTGRTTILGGTVSLEAAVGPSVSADLVIGDGTPTNTPKAQVGITGINQIPDQGRVEVIAGGQLHVYKPEVIGDLTLKDGRVDVFAPAPGFVVKNIAMVGGTFAISNGPSVATLAGGVTATSSAVGPATIIPGAANPSQPQGSLTLTGPFSTFTVNDGPAANDLDVSISLAGAAGLVKTGPGTLRFSGARANSYQGETVVRLGRIDLARTAIAIPAGLQVGVGGGSANVFMLASDNIADTAAVSVGFSGVLRAENIGDTVASLTVGESGELRLGDDAKASLKTSKLEVSGGKIVLQRDSTVIPLVTFAATSTAAGPAMIAGTGRLLLEGNGLNLSVTDGPQAIDLRIEVPMVTGAGSVPDVELVKRGAGAVLYAGDNPYTWKTRVLEGALLVNGTQASKEIILQNGKLAGTGTVVAVSATGGVFAPGFSPGRMTMKSLALNAGMTLAMEVNGPTPGSDYDQIIAEQSVSLLNATLALTSGGSLPPGASILLIDNRGTTAVAGTFAGLPEGAVVNAGSARLEITYRGGDGNDIVLSDVSSLSYFLAEGATGDFFDDDVLIANPNAKEAPVTLTFLQQGGAKVVEHRVVRPMSRLTIHVEEIPGLEATSASVQVDSDKRLPLIVERTMFWDSSRYGGHTANAVSEPATRWTFAEGFQGFFDTFILIANANKEPVNATLTFLREGDTPVVKSVPIAPFARHTVYAGDYDELKGRAFGIVVDATHPVIAERAMYFASVPGRFWSGGHVNTGIVAPSTSWFHAEGATGCFFSTFILLSNPQDTPAHVELSFLLDTGEVITRNKTLEARQRLTVNPAAEEDARLENAAVSTVVQSDVPIVSERSMYWEGEQKPLGEGHNSSGVTAPALRWGLAEGRVGGEHAYDTFILLANPGKTAAEVTVTFLRESGAPIVKTYTVPATSRFNIDVKTSVTDLVDSSFGARIDVTNNVPIVVERSMYWNANGAFWAGGTNALGTPIP
jgi:autotransporter-associated beta strand protein